MINEQLLPLAVSIDSLVPDPKNAREHDERSIETIKDSLREFGQQKPIVIESNGTVRAGNGTLQAARELGWKQIAAVVYDGTGDLEAFAIADNRSAELSRWDYRQLTVQLKSLQSQGFDVKRLGWADYELEPLLHAEWRPPKVDDTLGSVKDEKKKIELTIDQWRILDQAMTRVRRDTDDARMSDGRALELICADYLAGLDPVLGAQGAELAEMSSAAVS